MLCAPEPACAAGRPAGRALTPGLDYQPWAVGGKEPCWEPRYQTAALRVALIDGAASSQTELLCFRGRIKILRVQDVTPISPFDQSNLFFCVKYKK